MQDNIKEVMQITKEMVLASINICEDGRKAFLSFDGTAMEYFKQDPRGTRAAAYVLQHASSVAFRNNREFVMIAVSQDGWALKYASQEFCNDREVVLAAVQNDGWALQYASEELRNCREVVLTAITQSGWALQYASPVLRNCKEVVLAAITKFEQDVYFQH